VNAFIKTLFYFIVAAELALSSCATTNNLGGEFDDLYYSRSLQSIAQNNEKTNIQSKLQTKQDLNSRSGLNSVQPAEAKVPGRESIQTQNPRNLENSKSDDQNTSSINNDKRKTFISVGIDSRIQSWEISKKSTFLTNTDFIKKGMYSPIEEANSEGSTSFGPEIELFLGSILIRASYLWGNYNFEVGKVTRKDIAFDFGIEKVKEKWRAGMYIGWRGMMVNYSEWTSINLEKLSISDGVFGFLAGSSPNKKGFLANLDGAIGFGIFSGYEGIFLINAQIGLGYRFKTFPIDLYGGFGVYDFGKPTSDVKQEYNSFYNMIIRSIETQQNLFLGPELKIRFCF
jgi:hypothetical protein